MGTRDQERLLLTSSQIYPDEQHIFLNQVGVNQFSFRVTPPLHEKLNGSVHLNAKSEQSAQDYSATVPAVHPILHFKKISKAGDVPPARLGSPVSWRKAVAIAPNDADFDHAAKWSITIPPSDWVGAHDLFLNVKYVGDVARLVSDGKLLTDDFYNGNVFQIGLRRFREPIGKTGLELQILPMRKDAPIFLEDPYRMPPGEGQIGDLKDLTLVPEYQLTIDLSGAH
jgi:hypothetical protein